MQVGKNPPRTKDELTNIYKLSWNQNVGNLQKSLVVANSSLPFITVSALHLLHCKLENSGQVVFFNNVTL